MKKIRRTLKAHISGMAWRIQLKFGIGGAPPRGNSHRKLRVSVRLQMRENSVFFTPVKYTLVCRVPRFLGPHDTLPCVLIKQTQKSSLTQSAQKSS